MFNARLGWTLLVFGFLAFVFGWTWIRLMRRLRSGNNAQLVGAASNQLFNWFALCAVLLMLVITITAVTCNQPILFIELFAIISALTWTDRYFRKRTPQPGKGAATAILGLFQHTDQQSPGSRTLLDSNQEPAIEFMLTVEDVEAFQRYHEAAESIAPEATLTRTPPKMELLLFGLVALLLVAYFLLGNGPALSFPIALMLLASLFSTATYLFVPWFSHRKGRRPLRTRKSSTLAEKQRLRISPSGISLTTSLFKSTICWTGIEEIAVTEDHAFFCFATTSAYVLPRSAFAVESEFEAFLEQAERLRLEALAREDGAQI